MLTRNIVRRVGDTYPEVFTLAELGAEATDTFTMTGDLRKDPPDATTQIFEITGTAVDPTVSFDFTAAATQEQGVYFYDVKREDGSLVQTVAFGTIEFTIPVHQL